MPYYTRTYNPQPTQRVASTDLKNEFQAIDNALDAVETDVGKGVRAPEATTALPNAASRANKVLSFDGSGNPAVPIAVVDLTNAVTAATNAANSATAAATSATNAASSATAAATSASNASASETNAAASASTATTQASNASTSATAAASSASAASTSATNAASSASAAATSATNASNSASAAATSETNAGNSATAAATSATNASASFDAFDDRYLGSKTSNPTLDNDGNALLTGALYWNSSANEMRVWSGSAWVAAYVPVAPGGSWVYLSTVTASNSATVDIETTFDSTYDQYVVVITGVRSAAASGDLRCRLKVGGAYDTAANYVYRSNAENSSASSYTLATTAAVGSKAAFIAITSNSSLTNAAGFSASAFVHIANPASTSLVKSIHAVGRTVMSDGNIAQIHSVGYNTATTAMTGIRFYDWSGNIGSGTFRLYGIKNS